MSQELADAVREHVAERDGALRTLDRDRTDVAVVLQRNGASTGVIAVACGVRIDQVQDVLAGKAVQ